jgi:hypothetical protein
MSHFTEMQVEYSQDSEQHLIEALESVFGKGTVEVHEKGTGLYGYRGDLRSKHKASSPDYAPPCHLIVRRKHIGSMANDIGYRRTEDGKYVAYISEYDVKSNFDREKQIKVQNEYGARTTVAKLQKSKTKPWSTTINRLPNGAIVVVGQRG